MSEVIYLVSRGNYSDYRVLAAFTEKAVAEQVVAKIIAEVGDSWEPPFVEARALNPDVISSPFVSFRVNMEYDTGDGATVLANSTEEALDINEAVSTWGRRGEKKMCSTSCWADDAEHAIKIANERRTQHKAMKGIEHE